MTLHAWRPCRERCMHAMQMQMQAQQLEEEEQQQQQQRQQQPRRQQHSAMLARILQQDIPDGQVVEREQVQDKLLPDDTGAGTSTEPLGFGGCDPLTENTDMDDMEPHPAADSYEEFRDVLVSKGGKATHA